MVVGVLVAAPALLFCYLWRFGPAQRAEEFYLVLAVAAVYLICHRWDKSRA